MIVCSFPNQEGIAPMVRKVFGSYSNFCSGLFIQAGIHFYNAMSNQPRLYLGSDFSFSPFSLLYEIQFLVQVFNFCTSFYFLNCLQITLKDFYWRRKFGSLSFFLCFLYSFKIKVWVGDLCVVLPPNAPCLCLPRLQGIGCKIQQNTNIASPLELTQQMFNMFE